MFCFILSVFQKDLTPVRFALQGFPLFFYLIALCGVLAFTMLIVSRLVQIQRPTPLKMLPYESGMPVFGDARINFDIKFYLYALLFILFDIETIFLFPWALSLDKVGLLGLVEVVIFVGILFAGLVYAWRKDALRWE
ncbi:MAG: NADH-quinone oxidoreductase subunit A [Vampirovibrionales bacterium]